MQEGTEAAISTLQERLKALEERLTEHQRTEIREGDLEARSVERTRGEMERRLGEMNELRSQINSERALYVTRDMMDARLQAIMTRLEQNPLANASRIDQLQKRLDELERDRANLQGRFWAAGVALSILVMVVNWALRVSGH